jgi:xanthine dehydrogenase accessory factor
MLMKTWNETADILNAAQVWLANGQSCAIVVLTNVKGSAFRRPGAKLLIREDGSMTGNVSGGCLENDLRERALAAMQSGRQEMVHYNTGSDEDVIWGLGLGCDGELDLLILPLEQRKDQGWMEDVLAAMDRREALTLAWSLGAGPATPPVLSAQESLGRFLDVLEPPPDLLVVGAGDDTIPLVEQATLAGMRVTVIDHRPGYLESSRFTRAYAIKQLRPEQAAGELDVNRRTLVVIKNHALEMDKKWAHFFDTTEAAYIGILGPKKRCADVRAQMTTGNKERVYGPAGLDIGGEGAEQIAASIIAEILAVWAGRKPDHLRHREAPIHA